ncbi:MAG: hypothetical protein D6705_11385 [Deltaproteobacteria bacterium]|nr:MAG: hypothetical protein D6705_11385 [Deltaproteobacteria bacterium]
MLGIGAACAFVLSAAPRPEVFVDARDPTYVPGAARTSVHGEVGLGLGAGMMREDPFFVLAPYLALDFSNRAPVWLRIGAPIRLRLVDRAPDDPGVVRRPDYDEVGDYLAMLETFAYRDDLAFWRHGRVRIDLWVGPLDRAELPSRMLVADLVNGADLDRRRSGLAWSGRVEGRLVGRPAALGWQVLATDLAMGQVIGGAVETSWAGAFVAFEGAGDPTAPHGLERDVLDDDRFHLEHGRTLVAQGRRGVGGMVLSAGYRYDDQWRVVVGPRLDLVSMPGLGRGLAFFLRSEFRLGPARDVALGVDAGVTYGDDDFEPAYFGALYVLERWQMPFSPGRRAADLGAVAVPKRAFVDREDVGGVGGRGRMRLRVGRIVELSAGYGWRPGPLGAQFDAGLALDLASARLEGRVVHRGRHGFGFWDPAGTLARLRLVVPVVRWVDVAAEATLAGAMRPDDDATNTAAPTGFMGSAGAFFATVVGKVPW